MERQTDRLVVRQHSRYQCDQPARLIVDAPHAEQVVFSQAALDSRSTVVARIVDCSQGGLGIESGVFVPKGCLLLVRVLAAAAVKAPPAKARPDGKDAVEVAVRVQRVAMINRRPTYYLGAAFVNIDQPTRDRLEAVLGPAVAPAKGGGGGGGGAGA